MKLVAVTGAEGGEEGNLARRRRIMKLCDDPGRTLAFRYIFVDCGASRWVAWHGV